MGYRMFYGSSVTLDRPLTYSQRRALNSKIADFCATAETNAWSSDPGFKIASDGTLVCQDGDHWGTGSCCWEGRSEDLDWLVAISEYVILPSGHNFDGHVTWEGEDWLDNGVLYFKGGQLRRCWATIPDPDWSAAGAVSQSHTSLTIIEPKES